MLNYPLTYSSVHMNGPTLFYIDEEGSPIQLELNNEQVQSVIDDWNVKAIDESEVGEPAHELKPPRAL